MTYTKRLVFFAVMLLFVSISALSNTNVLASDDSIVPPLCGFAAEDGRIITVFDTSKYIVSNGTEEDAHLGPVSTSIPAGTYAVSLYSWDGYEGRSSTAQTDESWLVALKNDTTDITSTSPVSDIPDGVEQATVSEMVETHLVIPTDVNSVTAVHAIYPSDAEEYNSVHPICAAFDRIEEEPEEEQGSISICKMTLDAYGDIIDGSEYATSFTIPGLTFAGNGTVKESTGTLPDSVFQTPLSLNTTFISSSHDAECITYDELPFGGYFYGEEILSNDGWNEPRYNDQHTISISSIDDFFPFSGELFTEDESDDVNRDTNADGHIILTEYQPHRTLVVLNQRTEWDFPEGPSCSLISESTGWYGEYFNYPASHPAMETLHLDPVDAYGDPLSDTIPWTADWYDAPYFRFSALDTDLEFGDEYFPFDPFTEERHTGFTGDHEFHFGVHWQALVTAPVDGSYEFRITSDDDSWIYIDGELVVNNSGEHSENTIFASTTLSSTPKKFDIFFAERNTKGSSMLFRFHDQDVVVKPFNPMCLVNEQPVITVIGNNPLLHLVGDTFTDPGATASDAEDGDITSSIVIGGDSVSSTTPIGSYTITYDVMDSDGLSADQKTRIVTVIPTECTDNDSRTVSFGDASVLADTGGIFFESDSRVFGSVFSNGTTISKNDPIVTGDLSVAGKSTINGDHTKHTLTVEGNAYGYGIRNIFVEGSAFSTTEIFSSTNGNGQKTIGGDAYADTIINTVILGDAYVVSSIDVNSPVSGSIIPLVSPPTPLAERNYAISPDDISAWKAVAAAGEDITPVSCPFRPTPGQHIGPAVVNCDMRMKDTDSVVLTGPLWVKGNLTMDDNSSITLDSSYEGNSEVIITDNPDDRISSSRFISESYSSITGTEDEDSAVLVISLNNAYREDPTAESAIRLRNHSFVPFVFAPDGHIFLEHETSTHGIEGYYVHLKNNAYVTGDLASKSITFSDSCTPKNNPPLITVLGDDPIIITEGDTFTDPGATASDAEDGDITSSIVIGGDSVSSTTPVGSYIITYDVMDSDGLSADQKTRTVTVEEKDDNGGGGGEEDPPQCSDDTDNDGDTFSDINDSACHTDGDPDNPDSYDPTIDTENSKPVITRLGGDITANVGDGFTDPGATASDAEDGDITSSIVIGGDSVNTGSAGTYVITYNVTDSAGLAADEVTRTVTVSGGSGSGGGGGSSGGGGGGNGPLGPVSGGGGSSITLQISNEAIALNAEGTAVVTWDTNLQATSRVIFDTLSHNTADKTLYPLTTPKDTSLSTSHSMTIYGLTAGTEYFFRPLSDRTNEEAIGIQLSLTPLSTTIAPPITTPVENIAQCSYLEEFIRLGTNNNPTEVRKLEVFLRDFEGFTDITVDGIYTQTDFDAVTTFQEKYFGDILAPWNHTAGTGYVYITTRKKINEIYCAKAFPLTSDQLREIDAFRTLIQSGVPTDTSIVGSANGSEENHNVAINNTVPAPDTTVSGTTTADIIASLGDTSDGASSNSEGTSSQVARVISALADNKGAVAIIFIGIGVLIIGLIILFVRKESVSAPTNIETPVPELIPSPTTEPTEIKNNSETHPPII